ncbi:MAG: NOG1 family protein [Candidatus Thorarchaeota archaeon]
MSQFKNIPYIPTADKLADLIFSRLKNIKVEAPKKSRYRRSDYSFYKTLYFRQFRTIFPELDEKLKNITESFPIIDDLHPFHRELIDVLYGIDNLRRALSRITNSRRSIASIKNDVTRKLGITKTAEEAKKVRTEAIGRIGSAIKNLESELNSLIEAKIQLSKVPDFNLFTKTIAFAGSPNAGKSSFVTLVSSGKPEIASYPFTTKELICGHKKFGFETIQLLDTPGLLDRPLGERNDIEIKSILALKHLADYIIFLYDPTIDASLTIEKQMNLHKDIKESFTETPILALINKRDAISPDQLASLQIKLGNIEAIATIESHTEELEQIITRVINEIPDRRLKEFQLKAKLKEKEDRSGHKEKIEWIFFDKKDNKN